MQFWHTSTPLDTGRKLNMQKTFKRRLGRLLNVYVQSIYVLCPGGWRYDTENADWALLQERFTNTLQK